MKLFLPLFIGLSASSIIPSKRISITVDVISIDSLTQVSDESDIHIDESLVDSSYNVNYDSPQIPLSLNLDATVTDDVPDALKGCSSLKSPFIGFDLKCGTKASGEILDEISQMNFGACVVFCDQVNECTGVGYDNYTRECTLLTGDIKGETVRNQDSAIRIKKAQASLSDKATTAVATSGECSSLETPYKSFDLFCNFQAFGTAIEVRGSDELTRCVDYCLETKECKTVSYKKSSKRCYLLSNVVEYYDDNDYDSATRAPMHAKVAL